MSTVYRTAWLCGGALIAALSAPGARAIEVPVAKVELRSAPSNQAFCEGTKCWIVKGAAARVMVHGVGVAQANAVSDSSAGLTSSLTGAGSVGQKEVNLRADDDAARGEKTVTLKYRLNNNTVSEWKFRVYVMNRGRISGFQMPPINDFFTEVEVDVSGDHLGNAYVQRYGMGDYHNPAPEAVITSNSSSLVRVKLTWPTKQASRPVKFRLCDQLLPHGELCTPVKYGQVETVAKGPPAIAAVTFAPQPAKKGEVLTMNITLTGPARANGETIYWQVADHANFASAEPGCPFSTIGRRNQLQVPAGSTAVSCKLKVAGAQGVGPMTQWLKTWVVNPTLNDAPYFNQYSFQIKSL